MRKRLTLLVTATTGLVLVVFVIPLGLIVQRFAAQTGSAEATTRAESLVAVVASADRGALRAAVEQLNAGQATPVTVFLPDGTQVGAPAPRTTAVLLAEHGRSVTIATGDGHEIALAVVGLSGGTAVVHTVVTNAQLTRGVGRAWLVLGLLALALLLVAVYVADRLARSMVRSIADVAQVSGQLAAGTLEARAVVSGPPEVQAVSAALNQLAGRIQDLIHQAREEVADLSHRLRTPLAALRMEVDMMVTGAAAADQAQRVAARVDGLERAVTALIRDARRRGDQSPHWCDATEVVRERVAFWSALADDEARQVTVELAAAGLPVRVPAAELSACLDALLGNVFTHTPPGTPFAVTLERLDGGARLRVVDRGTGFEGGGFEGSVDAVRRGASGAGSTGLGLDIARRVAHTSGGSFHVDSSADGVHVVLDLGAP
jgi:signal transduction histidine kinase